MRRSASAQEYPQVVFRPNLKQCDVSKNQLSLGIFLVVLRRDWNLGSENDISPTKVVDWIATWWNTRPAGGCLQHELICLHWNCAELSDADCESVALDQRRESDVGTEKVSSEISNNRKMITERSPEDELSPVTQLVNLSYS